MENDTPWVIEFLKHATFLISLGGRSPSATKTRAKKQVYHMFCGQL